MIKKKAVHLTLALAILVLFAADSAMAAQTGNGLAGAALDLKPLGKGIATGLCGLAVVGGGPGIGRIGGSACEAIARQPEAANVIAQNMILTAALVEGATLFAVLVGLLALFLI